MGSALDGSMDGWVPLWRWLTALTLWLGYVVRVLGVLQTWVMTGQSLGHMRHRERNKSLTKHVACKPGWGMNKTYLS